MKVLIQKSTAKGRVQAPPSNSLAHRMLICGALSGNSQIENLSASNDIAATVSCLKAMGAAVDFDGKTAKVIDRYGNEKPVWFTSDLKSPRGKFKAELTARSMNRCTPRAQLTIGFTGKEIK